MMINPLCFSSVHSYVESSLQGHQISLPCTSLGSWFCWKSSGHLHIGREGPMGKILIKTSLTFHAKKNSRELFK